MCADVQCLAELPPASRDQHSGWMLSRRPTLLQGTCRALINPGDKPILLVEGSSNSGFLKSKWGALSSVMAWICVRLLSLQCCSVVRGVARGGGSVVSLFFLFCFSSCSCGVTRSDVYPRYKLVSSCSIPSHAGVCRSSGHLCVY